MDEEEEDQSTAFKLPEEIVVFEILLRLAIKPLFVFKCVSKRYKYFISHPSFARRYLQRANSSLESFSSSGLVASMLVPYTNLSNDPKLLSKSVKDLSDIVNSGTQLDRDDQLSICVSSVSLPTNESMILALSNGLILCIFDRRDCTPLFLEHKLPRFGLHVSNPLTKHCVVLPEVTLTDPCDLVYGIATKLVHRSRAFFSTYKVVLIRGGCARDLPFGSRNIEVDVFSSDTGSWVSVKPRGWQDGVVGFGSGRVGLAYKGELHWLADETGTITMYDPYNKPDQFGRIRLPNQKKHPRFHGSLVYSGEGEMLKYCQSSEGGR